MKRILATSMIVTGLLVGTGCSHQSRAAYPATTAGLELDRVVLYRNGIGYFERRGELDGDVLRIKVRKDQVNDLLKSLTVVDRKSGRALSVSMPLDAQTWANTAMATLSPGNGSLADVLDTLRGVAMVLDTTQGKIAGRLVMVERIDDEPDPTLAGATYPGSAPQPLGKDHRVTLLDGQEMKTVRLSKVQSVTLEDGDLAMQFHRRLDATAGEGMFQQVDVAIRLGGEVDEHDLVVSYVVEAPMWKPTYRVVLPENGKGEALLQAWAVVDNVSGEDWRGVQLALTAGAPLAFRYDLHTPRHVYREDVSSRVHSKRARVAMGESTFTGEVADKPVTLAPPPTGAAGAPAPMQQPSSMPRRQAAKAEARSGADRDYAGYAPAEDMAEEEPSITLDDLRRSTEARARASAASGLTRYDIQSRVTVPDGTSTMVAIINEAVQGEETFLFRPGGAGSGYEANPYRVVRFKNSTPFVLEPGPIAIYSGGSFVGEGISETVGANSSAMIPFAVEPGIMVTRESESAPEEMKLLKIVRGTLHIERYSRVKTLWKATAQTLKDGFTVLIRHPRQGGGYQLEARPDGTEELPDAYVVPLKVPAGSLTAMLELIERRPMRTTIGIFDSNAVPLLERMLVAGDLSAEERAKLEPVVELRREIGKLDTQINGYKRQQRELDDRADKTRRNLRAIEKDTSPDAARLRRDLEKRLDEFTKEGDRLGREMVRLESTKLQLKIRLDDLLESLTIGK